MANIMNYSDRKKALKNYFGGKLSNHEGNMLNDLSNLDLYGKVIGAEDCSEPSIKKGYVNRITSIIGGLLVATAMISGCADKDNNPSDSNDVLNKTISRDNPDSSDTTGVDKTKTNDKIVTPDSLNKNEFNIDYYKSLKTGDNLTLMTSRGKLTGKIITSDIFSTYYYNRNRYVGISGPELKYVQGLEYPNKKYNINSLFIERFDIDKDRDFDLTKAYFNLNTNNDGTFDFDPAKLLFEGDISSRSVKGYEILKFCLEQNPEYSIQDKIKRGCKITE